jgi:hypothetical protein
MYQKPVIDHCPWPSSQFNNWHAQNELLSSSLIDHRQQPYFGYLDIKDGHHHEPRLEAVGSILYEI